MYSTCEENLHVEKILAVTKWTLPVITSFCHRVGQKVCAVYSGSLDKYSPFDSPTSQFTKLAFPELTDDCIQNPPLLIAAPSLRFISAQDSAGNSGIEPRGTRGKIKKNKRKKTGTRKTKNCMLSNHLLQKNFVTRIYLRIRNHFAQ